MTTNRWRVRHPGIGILAYNNEAEARIAAGTAGEVLPPVPPAELGGPVPPDADLRALVEIAARVEFDADQEPERLFSWDQALEVARQAYRDRVAAGLAAVLPAHRVRVLRESATELRRRASHVIGAGIAPGIMYAASVLTASATQPPVGPPSATVPAEHAPPVSGQAPEADSAAEAVGDDG